MALSPSSDAKSRIDRILRLQEQIDAIKNDIRSIYADEKADGGDKTAMGVAISAIRKRAKDKDAFDEREEITTIYLAAYYGLRAHAYARPDEPLPSDPAAQEGGVLTDAANSSSGRMEPSADGQTPVQGAEEMTASSLAKDAPDPEQGVQISRPGPLYHEAAAAAETAADYLREPAAVVSGQIIREGDAPRETGRHEGDDDHRTGEDASCPDAESRANVDDETAPVNGSESAVESASRPDAGRSASATSEKMDATGRRDGQPHSPATATEPDTEAAGAPAIAEDASRQERAAGAIIFEKTPPRPVRRHEFNRCWPDRWGMPLAIFTDDIREHGVQKPIVKIGDEVLDGWCRYTVARDLGVEYPVVQYHGDDPLADSVRLNLEAGGRLLTLNEQKQIAAKLAKVPGSEHRASEILELFGFAAEEAA